MSKKARGGRQSRKNTLRLLVLFALGLAPSTDLLGAESESSNVPKQVTRAELRSAVESGEKIVGGEIRGEDIAAVLAEWIAPERKCASNAGLQIEKSTIRGDINLDFKTPSPGETSKHTNLEVEDETEGPKADEERQRLLRWLTVPLLIKEANVNDHLAIDSVGFACMVDLSGSTFESGIDIHSATFGADLSAVGAAFKTGLEVFGTEFESAVGFRRARFLGNVEFIQSEGRKSVFAGDADFRESVFSRHASFLGSLFKKRMDFRNAQFVADVSFTNASLGTRGLVSLFSGPFYGADFGGQANFRNVRFTNLRILRSFFHGGADFHGAKGSKLQLYGVSVSGPLAFDDTKTIKHLELNSFGGSMVVRGEAIFHRAEFDTLTFVRTVFKDNVDFQGLAVRSNIVFNTVSFDGDLHFEDGRLPDPMQKSASESDEKRQWQIKFNDVTLSKGLYIDARQFLTKAPWWAPWREDEPRFDTNEVTVESGDDASVVKGPDDGRRVWREFGRAFDQAKNIELKNYAEYKLRLAKEAGEELREDPVERMTSVASRWFWGYGLRPFRVLLWLVIVVLVFAGIYWTQLANMARGAAAVSVVLARINYALLFSARTAWQLSYGYDQSTNFLFRAITTAESLLAKLLLAYFAYALTQTSPLLSELMKKLLP